MWRRRDKPRPTRRRSRPRLSASRLRRNQNLGLNGLLPRLETSSRVPTSRRAWLGKRFEVDGREYLGVKLYFQALSDDAWMSLGEAPFRLVDSRGVSVETDPEALFRKGWDYLDPSKASKAGTSTAGWLAYPLDEDVNDDMKLVVVSEEVSLEGLLDAPGDSKAARHTPNS